MPPTDPTEPHTQTSPPDATRSVADADLDAGLAAAFGGDTTRPAPPAPDTDAGNLLAGKYRLVERIGEGGMGSVWVAQQVEPVKRKVAVKLIKAGMDSKQVLARFEQERQALAVMDHPNVAKVLDAGTTPDGRPFFVMELVKGTPITTFCDARKLTPKERLELFVPVCAAIQHAHQKGIIHRDIKPSNVLVALYDDKPVPKVIDFGVAKATGGALTEHTLDTGFGAVLGTPQYMSPEQATFNNLDIDTRSDVYALGVLLYELLAGSPPFASAELKKRGLLEILRVVREEEPPRPSAKLSTADTLPSLSANRGTEPKKLTGLLRNELDWIVMKALEKDRTRRYDTANGFAADVLRYLSGEPVQAHPPTAGYRLAKFARKHRGPVLAAAVVAAALVVSALVSVTFGVKATDAERQAKNDRDAAVKAQGEATDERNRANAEAARATAAKEEQAASQYISDVQLLPLAFDKGTPAEVNKLLDSHRPKPGEPDRRGFEWHYWNRQQNPQVLTDQLPDCEPSRNSSWAVSDDGRRIGRIAGPATADDLPVLTVWDLATRQVVLKHRLPIRPPADTPDATSPVGLAPQFSPDGSRVEVEWSYSVRARVQPGGVVGPGGPNALRFGTSLRQVIDVDTGKVLLEPPGTGRIVGNGGRLSRDGRRFASVSGSGNWGDGEPAAAITVWDLDTGKLVTPEKPTTLHSQVQFHPDGETFLTTGPHTDPDPLLAAVAGGGTHLPTTRLSLREVKTGAERWAKLVPCGYLDDLTVSRDGKLIAGSLLDKRLGAAASVTVWDAATGNEVSAWAVPSQATRPQVFSLAFSPGGTRLRVDWINRSPMDGGGGGVGYAVGDLPKDGLIVLNPRTGTPFPPLETYRPEDNNHRHQTFSPDENLLITFDSTTMRTGDVRTGLPHRTVRGPVEPQLVRFTPDGKRLWTVESSGVYKEWDLRLPQNVTVEFEGGNERLAADFAVSADGGRFAHLAHSFDDKSGSDEFAVRMRDAEGSLGKLLLPPPRGVGPKPFPYTSQCGLALSRDGGRVLLTRSEARGVRVGDVVPADWRDGLPPPDLTVWDAVSGKRLLHRPLDDRLMPGAAFGGYVAVISPDGRSVAAGLEPAKAGDPVRVRLFDVDTGDERTACTLAGAMSLFTLTFSPDGKRLAAVSATHDPVGKRVSAKLVVWDASGGEPTVTADLYRDVKAPSLFGGYRGWFRAGVAWTPDGSRLIVTHAELPDAGFAVHDAATGKLLVDLERPATSVAYQARATSAVCSPDGKRIAAFLETVRNGPQGVKVWDAASGKEVLTLRKQPTGSGFGPAPGRADESQLAFTADGHKLLAWEFGQNQAWSEERGDYLAPGYVRTVWDASPPPEAKK